MCLEKANIIQLTEDIVCYKVLYGGKHDNVFSSPYQHTDYYLGKKLKLRRNEPKMYVRCNIRETETNFIIQGGAYHSFITKEQAKKWCKALSSFEDRSCVVVECIIPKTCKYVYKGIFGTDNRKENSYASSEIKPIKVVYQALY